MAIDRKRFFDDIRKVFGRLSQDQVNRINVALDRHEGVEKPAPPAPPDPPTERLFERTVRKFGPRLMKAFGLNALQAAAVFGNLGHESGGFAHLQEKRPTVKGSLGGYGWAQWTGPRRRNYMAFCKANKLDPADPEANFRFLCTELVGEYKPAADYLRRWTGTPEADLEQATKKFELMYEKAGVKHYPSRFAYAWRAYDVLKDIDMAATKKPEPMPPKFVEKIQEQLRSLDYYTTGKVDGVWGSSTTGAIAAWKHDNGIIPSNGDTLSESELNKLWQSEQKPVSEERASTTVQDLRDQGSQTIKQADGVSWTSRVVGIVSVLAMVLGFVSENWDEASAITQSLAPMLAVIPIWLWPGVTLIVAIYLGYKARAIKETRVLDERTGVHNGEPSPVGTPPSEAWSDTPQPKPNIAAVALDVITGGLTGFLTGGPGGAVIGGVRAAARHR